MTHALDMMLITNVASTHTHKHMQRICRPMTTALMAMMLSMSCCCICWCLSDYIVPSSAAVDCAALVVATVWPHDHNCARTTRSWWLWLTVCQSSFGRGYNALCICIYDA